MKAGERGTILLEDFQLRGKITHFDHERIPERIVHAVKPESNNEMPQAASAHDTFWDFVSLTPESMHTIHVGNE